jgi:hypothetical protein
MNRHRRTGAGVINLANGIGSYKKLPVQAPEKKEKQKKQFLKCYIHIEESNLFLTTFSSIKY